MEKKCFRKKFKSIIKENQKFNCQTLFISQNALSVCKMFVKWFGPPPSPNFKNVLTQEPSNRFASYFDWGTRENHGNVLNIVWLCLRYFYGENS